MSTLYIPGQQTSCVIDVSHNNPVADWADVKARNPWLRGVIAKASQGDSFTDPTWFKNRKGIAEAGLLVGAYHFCVGDVSPEDQIAHFLSVVGDNKGVLLALDWEPNPQGVTATMAQVEAMVMRVRSLTGRSPVIYCGRSMEGLPSPILATTSLWLAEYGTKPICPPGWSKWRLHQYTDKGIVGGITGMVDLSYHADTQGRLEDWWAGGTAPVLPVTPPDVSSLVKQLQAAVGAEPDGLMGPDTYAAIIRWQNANRA
jgi:lysozyme